MLEIIIMIGVIRWFAGTAKSKGKNGLLWGFIGAISYYGPVLVFGSVIYPAIVKGSVTYNNQGSYTLVGVLLNLAVGIGCCLLARKILLSEEGDNAGHCPRCHTELPDGADRCPHCDQAVCPECGSAVSDEAIQCAVCGTQFAFACPVCGSTVTAAARECAKCQTVFE